SAVTAKTAQKEQARPAKLSYKDQRELDALPKRIEALETALEVLHSEMAAPEFYQQDGAVIAETKDKLERLETEMAEAFERWEALEAQRS
ncbi:MAG: ABC transporter ATP-binding protein, partial [Gammaproteobacteria bacterium]|nr:ABC transporter ATP-binding protein [Gammaproteobacteria bacterium]